MSAITIRAENSALAFEEAIRRLGPSAYVLGIVQGDGYVDVTATTEAPPLRTAPTPRPLRTRPVPLATALAAQRIADRPAADRPDPARLPRRVVLAGPPGGGRTTLAARLAAEALQIAGAPRPRLVAPKADALTPEGRLRGWARLMGLVVHRPLWSALLAQPPAAGEAGAEIIDPSDVGAVPPEELILAAAGAGSQLWLAIPTGLHPALLAQHIRPFAGKARFCVMTRSDLFPVTEDDLAVLADHGMRPDLLSAGGGLLGALFAPEASLPGPTDPTPSETPASQTPPTGESAPSSPAGDLPEC